MTQETKKTPLYDRHRALGAAMVTFRGWEMPLWYPSGAVAEHRAVITHAGLFDTSHMSVLTIAGSGALALLQRCLSKDLDQCVGEKRARLRPGQCVFGAFLDERGWLIDDSLVYQCSEDHYVVCVNAGMGSGIARHLQTHAGGIDEVRIRDLTGVVGKLDIQGPMAARIMMRVVKDADKVLADMDYFTFKGHFDEQFPRADTYLNDGTPVLLSRTGFTGEFGFELFVTSSGLPGAWDMILAAGKDLGLVCCALAARDSLRAGALLPLSQQDMGPWPFINHPWNFALPYNEDGTAFTKEFIGSGVLALKDTADFTLPFAGFDPRKVDIHAPNRVVDSEGKEIGTVLTCVADMAIARVDGRIYSMASPDKPAPFKPSGLSCGFVRVKSRLPAGETVELTDSRRAIRAMIVDDVRPDRTARRPMREMM
jgi:aminomethyltransferase